MPASSLLLALLESQGPDPDMTQQFITAQPEQKDRMRDALIEALYDAMINTQEVGRVLGPVLARAVSGDATSLPPNSADIPRFRESWREKVLASFGRPPSTPRPEPRPQPEDTSGSSEKT